MTDDSTQGPIEIRSIALNLTPDVGADDVLVAVRLIPNGRDGNVVLARSLRPDEKDDDMPVVVNPALGERLRIPPGSFQISIRDVDKSAKAERDGYAPITNTIWTWLNIGDPAVPELFRHLLAAARRLDCTHALLVQVTDALNNNLSEGFIGRRQQAFRAISIAEILTVALYCSVDLLDKLQQRFSPAPSLLTTINSKKDGIRQMRDAFEHIEDRVLGQVRGKPHPDALTVFDQRDFISQGKLTYGKHSLDLHTEVPRMLVEARRYIYDAAVKVAGPARELAIPIEFFSAEER